MVSPRRARFCVLALLGVFALQASPGILRESMTYDEFMHLAYGCRALVLHDFNRGDFFTGMVPWNQLQAAPAVALERLGGPSVYPTPDMRFPRRLSVVLGRSVTLLTALGLGL